MKAQRGVIETAVIVGIAFLIGFAGMVITAHEQRSHQGHEMTCTPTGHEDGRVQVTCEELARK